MLLIRDLETHALAKLLERYGIRIEKISSNGAIPGSYWGESEAGLIRDTLFIRDDTPLHSALHEASHFICMDAARRGGLERDAGGDHAEENAVCYLQILLADHIADCGRACMQADMDTWGYTFRLGSASAWFETDADDARRWLQQYEIIDQLGSVTWRLRAHE